MAFKLGVSEKLPQGQATTSKRYLAHPQPILSHPNHSYEFNVKKLILRVKWLLFWNNFLVIFLLDLFHLQVKFK